MSQEKGRGEKQEVVASLAAAKEIIHDTAIAAFLSKSDGINYFMMFDYDDMMFNY